MLSSLSLSLISSQGTNILRSSLSFLYFSFLSSSSSFSFFSSTFPSLSTSLLDYFIMTVSQPIPIPKPTSCNRTGGRWISTRRDPSDSRRRMFSGQSLMSGERVVYLSKVDRIGSVGFRTTALYPFRHLSLFNSE